MDDQPNEQFARNIVKVTLFSSAILLNIWLLFVLCRDPMKRFRNLPSLIIANLALADIITAIGGLGSFTVIFICNTCVDIHKLFACIQLIGLQNSFVFITFLAFDRFLAISHPYKYNRTFSNKRCGAFLCFVGWAIGLILGPSVQYLQLKRPNMYISVLHILYVVNVVVLAVITATLYPLNYYNYLRKKRFLSASTHPVQAMEDLRLAQQLSVSSVIAATVLVTYMVPYIITLAYYLTECMECVTDKKFRKFWVNYQAMIGLVLLINPIIYAWRLPLYRKSSIVVAKNLFKMITKRRANQTSDNCSNTSTRITTMLTNSTGGTNDINVSVI